MMEQHVYTITNAFGYICPNCKRPASAGKGKLCLACCAAIAKDINRNAKPRYPRAK